MIMAIPANIMTKHRIWPIEMFKNDLNRAVGQILCFVMILAGIAMIIYAKKSEPVTYRKKNKGKTNADKRKS